MMKRKTQMDLQQRQNSVTISVPSTGMTKKRQDGYDNSLNWTRMKYYKRMGNWKKML